LLFDTQCHTFEQQSHSYSLEEQLKDLERVFRTLF